ncbi:MAG: FHA domain-containing protein [Marinilabiliales bacterium]|nr:FHA domain-containing protein [Marinilabiliales bacterium]
MIVPSNLASRKHGTVQVRDGGVYMTDVSSNGMFIDQQPLPKNMPIQIPLGKPIAIGDHFLVFEADAPPSAVVPVASAAVGIHGSIPSDPFHAGASVPGGGREGLDAQLRGLGWNPGRNPQKTPRESRSTMGRFHHQARGRAQGYGFEKA